MDTPQNNKNINNDLQNKVEAKVNDKEVRCSGLRNGKTCNAKLGEFDKAEGLIKCPKCGAFNVIKK